MHEQADLVGFVDTQQRTDPSKLAQVNRDRTLDLDVKRGPRRAAPLAAASYWRQQRGGRPAAAVRRRPSDVACNP